MVRFGNDIDGVELEPGQSIKDQNGNEVLRVTEDGAVVNSSEGSIDSLRTGDLYTDQLPDVVVKRDGADAVAVDMVAEEEISRADAITGRGAYPVMQAAVDSLGSGGGHIYIRSGRYSADDFSDFNGDGPLIIVNKDHVTISGDGPSTLFTIEDDATPSNEGLRIFDITGKRDNGNLTRTQYDFVLRDLKIDGNQQNNGGNGDGNSIDNDIDGHNIQIQARNFMLTNVHSVNSAGDGVEPLSRKTLEDGDPQTKNGVIANCVFKDSWEQNIHIHGGKNIAITGNVCKGEINNDSLNFYSGFTRVENIVIHGNVFSDGEKKGLSLYTRNSPATKNIVVTNNIIEGFADHGIALGEVQDNTMPESVMISNNIVRNNSGVGVFSLGGSDFAIHGNIITENGGNGIQLDDYVSAVDACSVRNNHLRDNCQTRPTTEDRAGIWIASREGREFNHVIVAGNTVLDRNSNGQHGIEFRERTEGTYNELYCTNNDIFGWSEGGAMWNQMGALQLWNNGPQVNDAMSGPPSSVYTGGAGTIYLDDGTETSDGNPHLRYDTGGNFVDL